ncbi:protein asunder homolog, partial [Notothenia coriiceps]|uniref:Protein asunder homolog n=1 Tax=Notothenia coriiceps TaxID=8208 RepID=A0A6I9MTE8_9TELE
MKPTLNVCEQEEQHANTSANYDVELLHHRDAHMEFFKSGDLHMAGSSTRENGLKETITLKWCTPRTNSIGGSSWRSCVCVLFHIKVFKGPAARSG